MIIRRALYQETSLATLAVTLILVLLFIFMGLTRLLGKAAIGEQAPDVIFILLSLELLRKIDLLLPLSLFIGLLLTLGRWYRDNEMTVLAACGVGIGSLLRPAMLLALGFAFVVALFSLTVSPLAVGVLEQVKSSSAEQHDISGIAPGTFTEVQDRSRIFYVDSIDEENMMMKKIFSSGRTDDRRDVITAASGYDYTDNESGDNYIVLKNGVRYVGEPGSGDYRVLRFETYALLVVPVSTERTQKRNEATATLNLLNSNDRGLQAELHWRLAKPISVFILTAFAMVLAYTDPRRGRVANLFVAILIYFIYTNLLGIGDTLLKSGRLPMEVGLWWVHAGFALLAGYFLFRRNRHRPLIAWSWLYRHR